MKRKGWLFICTWLLVMAICLPVQAKSPAVTPLSDFKYTLQASGSVLLTQYTGTKASVIIPDSYKIDGMSHPVELASKTVFRGNTRLTTVRLSKGVRFENNSMMLLFAQCTKLRDVKINELDTGAITDMSYLFFDCESLQTLDLSGWNTSRVATMKAMFSGCKMLVELKGYAQWDTSSLLAMDYMFNQTQKLQSVNLQRWKLSKLLTSAWCFQLCGAEEILLPADLAIISAGFVNHVFNHTGSTFTIPAGVKTIGYAHTFYDFGTSAFSEFIVSPGNTCYQSLDGILYSADGKEMLAIPRAKKFSNGVYTVPEGVTFFGELSFSRNYHVREVVLPDSYVLKSVPLYDAAYITHEDKGNLNAGLNLNIAVYAYTGITTYTVKDSNPNYRSIDGVLYSKDLTTLVAVPTRYNRYLQIPEGVAVWRSDAMWCAGEAIDGLMKDCSGVYIPATLTDIAPDQLAKLNRLKKHNTGFKISVSEDNPVYYINRGGNLAKKEYLADLQIRLDETTLTYDGTPKTPTPVISYNGNVLTEGKDYTLAYMDHVNAGTGRVRIIAQAAFYGTVERSFTIEKATPAYILPTNITATYGQRLHEIALPEGFSWKAPMTLVGDVGEHAFSLQYTNADPNYKTVEDISVTVSVQPKVLQITSLNLARLQPWRGKPIEPEITVTDGDLAIPENEYKVAYENNVGFGTASVYVTDEAGGNYTVAGSDTFVIVPGPLLVYIPLTVALTVLAAMLHRRRTSGKKAAPSAKP